MLLPVEAQVLPLSTAWPGTVHLTGGSSPWPLSRFLQHCETSRFQNSLSSPTAAKRQGDFFFPLLFEEPEKQGEVSQSQIASSSGAKLLLMS